MSVTNLFNFGTTITGVYDEAAKTITIPAGQHIYSNSYGNCSLYTYTTDENSQRIIDKASPIVFNISEGKTYNTFKSDQDFAVVYDEDGSMYSGSTYASYTSVGFRNYQNAVITCETESDQSIKTEEYPVYVERVAEGRYLIRNFDQRARVYLDLNREQASCTLTFGEYPAIWSSTIQNYYYPCAFELNGSSFRIAADRNLYGEVNEKSIKLQSIWSYISDNRDNEKVEEEYRKIYRYNSDMHYNTTITLTDEEMRFQFPHATHEVTTSENFLMTKDNFDNAYQTGWMWSGNELDDQQVGVITNKTSTIEPFTDNTISKTTFAGLNIKNEGNGMKNIYMRVKGIDGLKFYVTSNGSDERTAIVTATPDEGATVTVSLPSGGTGAMKQIDGLDASKTYTIEFYTSEKDMTLFAVQLLKNTTGISIIENVQCRTERIDGNWYTLDGRTIDKWQKTKGIYIRNGKKVVVK